MSLGLHLLGISPPSLLPPLPLSESPSIFILHLCTLSLFLPLSLFPYLAGTGRAASCSGRR